VDAKEEHRVVAIRAKPPFRPLLEIATTRPDSDVELYVLEKEAPAVWGEQQAQSGPCFWVETWETRTPPEMQASIGGLENMTRNCGIHPHGRCYILYACQTCCPVV